MSLATTVLSTILLATYTLAGSTGGAFSHVFQSTPDYTISHQHFHENIAAATPYLAVADAKNQQNYASLSSIINAAPQVYQTQSQPGSYDPKTLRATDIAALDKTRPDLPPGYVPLAGMIDVPPGYQLFKSKPEYY